MSSDSPDSILRGLDQMSSSTNRAVRDFFDNRIRKEARKRSCGHQAIISTLRNLSEKDLKEWVRNALPRPSKTSKLYPDELIPRIANDLHRYLHLGESMYGQFG